MALERRRTGAPPPRPRTCPIVLPRSRRTAMMTWPRRHAAVLPLALPLLWMHAAAALQSHCPCHAWVQLPHTGTAAVLLAGARTRTAPAIIL